MLTAMRTPVAMAWAALLLAWQNAAFAEACRYDVRGSYSQANDAQLTLTKSQALTDNYDEDGKYVTIAAARLDYVEAGTTRYYLNIDFSVPHFVESEEEGTAVYDAHSPMIPKGLEATLALFDETTVVLKSWGMFVGRMRDVAHLLDLDPKDFEHALPITPPGKRGNNTDLYLLMLDFDGGYDMDDQQLQALIAQPLREVEITTEKGDVDVTVRPAFAETLQHLLRCIRD